MSFFNNITRQFRFIDNKIENDVFANFFGNNKKLRKNVTKMTLFVTVYNVSRESDMFT